MSTYVYGFTHTAHPLPVAGLVGVGAQAPPVRLVRQDGLVAVVSDAPENLRAKRRDLEAHQRVLDALCSAGTVLPMRFGMVAPDDEAVRSELAASAARYTDLLGELAGRTEVNVKGEHREQAILTDVLLRHRELRERNEALRAAGGGAYADRAAFGERVAAAVEQRRDHDAERVLARLRPHASRVRLGPPVDGCFVNASFLVPTTALSAFESSVYQLRDEMAAYADVRWFGPLPPYSFVAEDARTEA
jgi:Gas vesicle synthesis protein GvpL/GvpF